MSSISKPGPGFKLHIIREVCPYMETQKCDKSYMPPPPPPPYTHNYYVCMYLIYTDAEIHKYGLYYTS